MWNFVNGTIIHFTDIIYLDCGVMETILDATVGIGMVDCGEDCDFKKT